MSNPISLPGFEGRTITVESSMWSGQPKLTLDGVEIKPASQTPVTFTSSTAPLAPPTSNSTQSPKGTPRKGARNEFLLRQNDGREVMVRVKPKFPDPAPLIEINGQTIRSARPLSVFEWIWAGLPLVLLALGGAIGGGIGAFAAISNITIIRDDSKGLLRYVMCAIISLFAFLAWLALTIALQAVLRR
ncbi:hypothetical protein EON80_26240 [bacterium]|nr:MAG: hypothetical protein EON80_26240 [bacterium]